MTTTQNSRPDPARPLPTEAGQVSEKEARQVAEAAREAAWDRPSFGKELFLGRFRLDLISPWPRSDPQDAARAEEFLGAFGAYLDSEVDGAAIERDARIPDEVFHGLARLGAFGMKIDRKYGGLGLSNLHYCRALMRAGSVNPAISALLSAHQSIGVPQPLKMFGTPEQKQRFLPRLAAGEVSAFLLTEPDVGSDPARLATTAEPTEDGTGYRLNGVKLWATNGTVATLLVVMARVPAAEGRRGGITAFVVEGDSAGITVERRNAFVGLRGLENSLTRFHDVFVPKENVIGGEGKGLKIALTTLNTGRLSLPAMCVGAGKWSLNVAREWAADRVQWGRPVGEHEAVAKKLAFIAATTYGMESMLDLCCLLADDDRNDIRIEAALVKLYASEMAWKIADELIQIRGGRGYETAESLAARGERPAAVEQLLRDLRINRIFEGSTEIMHLLIAREAVDAHLSVAGDIIDPDARLGRKAKAGAGPPSSTRGGCPRSPWARARRPGRTPSSARWPATCGTSSAPVASWPAPPSTRCPAGRGRWSASRRSSAGWWTSARSCSRWPRSAYGPPPSGRSTRRTSSWPTCSAGRRGCASTSCSPGSGRTPTRWTWRPRSGSSPAGTPPWRRAW